MALHPLQLQFAQEFLNNRERAAILIAPTGSGKTRLLIEVVRKGFVAASYRRVLIVCPGLVQEQIAEALHGLADRVPIVRITKSQFRSLESGLGEQGITWNDSFVGLIGSFVLRQDSVLTRLTDQVWDLVAVDEAQVLDAHSLDAVTRLASSRGARRLLILTALDRPQAIIAAVPDAVVTRWNLDTFLRREPIRTSVLEYSRSAREVRFLQHLVKLINDVSLKDRAVSARRMMLSAAGSSLFAVQALLLRESHRMSLLGTSGSTPSGLQPGMSQGLGVWWRKGEPVLKQILALVNELDQIQEDPKLAALQEFIESGRQPSRRIVAIFTTADKTADYLREALAARGHRLITPATVISGDIHEHSTEPQIYVLTDRELGAVDISAADTVVHYDLPLKRFAMERRIGRSDTAARLRSLSMAVVSDRTGSNVLEVELFRRYRKYLVTEPRSH